MSLSRLTKAPAEARNPKMPAKKNTTPGATIHDSGALFSTGEAAACSSFHPPPSHRLTSRQLQLLPKFGMQRILRRHAGPGNLESLASILGQGGHPFCTGAGVDTLSCLWQVPASIYTSTTAINFSCLTRSNFISIVHLPPFCSGHFVMEFLSHFSTARMPSHLQCLCRNWF